MPHPNALIASPAEKHADPVHSAARTAPGVPSALSKEEINNLPIRGYEGDVALLRGEDELRQALDELRREQVLGFDTETRPIFFRGKVSAPALIQLAGAKRVYLVHLAHMPFQRDLAALLADAAIIKAGVGIRDDMKALAKLSPFEPAAAVDLAVLARSKGIKAQGLRTLAAALLGFRISKGAQCSNWENSSLTPRQIKYAATDAWVGRELYLALNREYKDLNPLL